MTKTALVILFQIICTAGFSENPRWKEFGTPIPAHANLDVRWETSDKFVGSNVPTNEWPSKMWIYHLTPRTFSPKVISNLMTLCSFTEKNRVRHGPDGVTFKSPDGLRTLSISFSSGSINYDAPEPGYVLKPNVFVGVPKTEEMPKLTKNFLKLIGVKLSEIQKNTNGAPYFYFSSRGYEYFSNHTLTTNTWARAVVFRRSVNGAEVIGNAGYCELQFGEQGKILKIDFSWPTLKRYKSSPTLTPQTVLQLLQHGKAHQGLVPMGFGDIDWQTVKNVTIKQAWPCYFAGNSDLLYPFLDLWTTVEASQGNVDIEIDCPIIDETEP